MTIEVGEKGSLEFKKVYNPITLYSDRGEILQICLRDGGFEFTYEGTHYEAKEGKIARVLWANQPDYKSPKTKPENQNDKS